MCVVLTASFPAGPNIVLHCLDNLSDMVLADYQARPLPYRALMIYQIRLDMHLHGPDTLLNKESYIHSHYCSAHSTSTP